MMEQALLQFLGVWAELEAAYYGENSYGGNVAEIYAYRLLVLAPLDPTGENRGAVAAREMERLLQMFVSVHVDARFGVEVGYRKFEPFIPVDVSGRPGTLESFNHRIHLRITKAAA